jgi:integrase
MAIEKRGDGYRVRWRTLSGEARCQQCPSRRTAVEIDAAVKEAHCRKRDYEPAPVGGEPAVSEIARAYMESRAVRFRKHTMRVDGMHLDLFQRFLKQRDPKHSATAGVLSRALLDEFLTWLMRKETSRHGKKARRLSSAAKSVRAVQQLWKWADGIDRWPGIPRPREMELPRAVSAAVVAPTWAEMDSCVLACRDWQRQLATWLRYTGLRAGESMLLLWTDLDLKRGMLTIRPEISKTGVGRTIPISPIILDEIATWGKREGYLIPTKRHADAKHHRDPRARDILRAWKRAGVREEVWRQRPEHAFRRGWKSGMLQLGANADAVDYLQGHSLGAGSRGRYIDAMMLPLVETVAKVPAIGAETNVVKLKARG